MNAAKVKALELERRVRHCAVYAARRGNQCAATESQVQDRLMEFKGMIMRKEMDIVELEKWIFGKYGDPLYTELMDDVTFADVNPVTGG